MCVTPAIWLVTVTAFRKLNPTVQAQNIYTSSVLNLFHTLTTLFTLFTPRYTNDAASAISLAHACLFRAIGNHPHFTTFWADINIDHAILISVAASYSVFVFMIKDRMAVLLLLVLVFQKIVLNCFIVLTVHVADAIYLQAPQALIFRERFHSSDDSLRR